jgi:hypothetical protein
MRESAIPAQAPFLWGLCVRRAGFLPSRVITSALEAGSTGACAAGSATAAPAACGSGTRPGRKQVAHKRRATRNECARNYAAHLHRGRVSGGGASDIGGSSGRRAKVRAGVIDVSKCANSAIGHDARESRRVRLCRVRQAQVFCLVDGLGPSATDQKCTACRLDGGSRPTWRGRCPIIRA